MMRSCVGCTYPAQRRFCVTNLEVHARVKKAGLPDDTVLVSGERSYTRILHSWECAKGKFPTSGVCVCVCVQEKGGEEETSE